METAKSLLEKASSEEMRQTIICCKDKSTFNNALHYAAQKNHVEFTTFLLEIIDPDNEMLVSVNNQQQNALMEAAKTSVLRISRAILEKVNEDSKILNAMLTAKCNQKLSAINHAIRSTHKNSEKCAKIIISYFGDDSDVEQIFLPCLQLGDLKLAEKLWDRTKGDDALRKRLQDTKDKDGYNCFMLVSKNGQYECLKWLLTLNDDNPEEADEDEKVCIHLM